MKFVLLLLFQFSVLLSLQLIVICKMDSVANIPYFTDEEEVIPAEEQPVRLVVFIILVRYYSTPINHSTYASN